MKDNELNNIRLALGISEGRAKELEKTISKHQLPKCDLEYLERIMDLFEDEVPLIPRPRILERQRLSLGIDEEQAKQLESMLINLHMTIEEQEYMARCLEHICNNRKNMKNDDNMSKIRNTISDYTGISQDAIKEVEEKGKRLAKDLGSLLDLL